MVCTTVHVVVNKIEIDDGTVFTMFFSGYIFITYMD